MDDSVITCDKIIKSYDEKTKTIPTNFNEKKATCKTQNFYILLAFLLITIALLMVVIIFCYLINIEQNKNIYYHLTTVTTNSWKFYINKFIKIS